MSLLDAVPEYSADLATHTMGREAGAATVDALQDGQNVWRVDVGNWALAKPREHIVFHSGERLHVLGWLDGALALVHPAARDCLEGVGRCEPGGTFLKALDITWVESRCQLLAGVVSLFPRCRKRHVRIDAERERLVLAGKPEVHPPVFRAGLVELEIHAAAVREAIAGSLGVVARVPNLHIGQQHGGISLWKNPETSQIPPKIPPDTTGCRRTKTDR
jgi:hypothetical protein